MQDLETPDRMRMNNLIKMLIFKAEKGNLPKSLTEIRKIPLKMNKNSKKEYDSNNTTDHTDEGPTIIN